jgi:hypothetical protein
MGGGNQTAAPANLIIAQNWLEELQLLPCQASFTNLKMLQTWGAATLSRRQRAPSTRVRGAKVFQIC